MLFCACRNLTNSPTTNPKKRRRVSNVERKVSKTSNNENANPAGEVGENPENEASFLV